MIKRQANFLGNQRIDIPHLRALESSLCNDFDLLAGQIMAGNRPLVVTGFDIIGTSGQATSLQLNVGGGVLFHPGATEAGTIFSVVSGTTAETLGSNAKIVGAWTSSQVNYVGLDLLRTADATTSDLVEFLDANTLLETPYTVPLARTLDYRIIITTVDFSSDLTVLPIAKVTLDSSSAVTAIEDARNMMFRLATGGSLPDTQHSYPWAQNRDEAVNVAAGDYFHGGDKSISSMKDYFDAVNTRLWEIGGGESWYSATSDRDVKLALGPPALTSANFIWTLGSQNLMWSGLTILFANSTATYNTITNDVAVGVTLAKGYCIYVDVDRATEAKVLTVKGPVLLSSLGSPTIPGSRFVLAWRPAGGANEDSVFVHGSPWEVGRAGPNVATYTAGGAADLGVVRLTSAPDYAGYPSVVPIDANGQCAYTCTSAAYYAFLGTGCATGGSTLGAGIKGIGGTWASGGGSQKDGGYGISGIGGNTDAAGSSGGHGLIGTGGNGLVGGGAGGYCTGGNALAGTNVGGRGLVAIGGAGYGGAADGPGVYATGGGSNGKGGVFYATGVALGIQVGLGDIQIPTGNNYTYGSAKSYTMLIPAASMAPNAYTIYAPDAYFSLVAGATPTPAYRYWARILHGTSAVLLTAPLNLPQGASITKVGVLGCNKNSASKVWGVIIEKVGSNGACIESYNSSGTFTFAPGGTGPTLVESGGLSFAIAADYGYTLFLYTPGYQDGDVNTYGVIITYTITTVAPPA